MVKDRFKCRAIVFLTMEDNKDGVKKLNLRYFPIRNVKEILLVFFKMKIMKFCLTTVNMHGNYLDLNNTQKLLSESP